MLDLKSFIRDVPDFPKKGVVFKDITTLLNNVEAFREAINRLCEPENLDSEVGKVVKNLLRSAPGAITECKRLIRRVPWFHGDELNEYTARTIARIRAGDEAQEGTTAFMEKRPAEWIVE